MINPTVINRGYHQRSVRETCSIWPEESKTIVRYSSITVTWTNEKDVMFTKELKNNVADMFQHQFDHLNGKCICGWRN